MCRNNEEEEDEYKKLKNVLGPLRLGKHNKLQQQQQISDRMRKWIGLPDHPPPFEELFSTHTCFCTLFMAYSFPFCAAFLSPPSPIYQLHSKDRCLAGRHCNHERRGSAGQAKPLTTDPPHNKSQLFFIIAQQVHKRSQLASRKRGKRHTVCLPFE